MISEKKVRLLYLCTHAVPAMVSVQLTVRCMALCACIQSCVCVAVCVRLFVSYVNKGETENNHTEFIFHVSCWL